MVSNRANERVGHPGTVLQDPLVASVDPTPDDNQSDDVKTRNRNRARKLMGTDIQATLDTKLRNSLLPVAKSSGLGHSKLAGSGLRCLNA